MLSILLLSFVAGFGQSEFDQKKDITTVQAKKARIHITTFGFKGGYNRSIVKGYETIGAKTAYTGNELYGSFFADTELSDKLNFENELLVSWTDNYHFVEVPLHLKYKFTSKWSAFAGPKLDIIADNDNDPFESSYKFRNFGVSGELGAQYTICSRLFVETRYSRSFISQITNLFLDINEGKRHTLRLGAGIKF
jgi:hypothetical protein